VFFALQSPRLSIMKIYHLTVLLVFLLRCTGFAAPNIVHGEDQFEFTYRVTLPQLNANAEMWLPLAKTDAFQTVKSEHISMPVEWRKVQDRQYKNKILLLSLGPDQSGKTIEIDYTVQRREKRSYDASGAANQYLQPERLVPLNQTFKSIATNLITGKVKDMERDRALYDHVLSRMKYDKSGTGWGRGDAVYACDAHTGNCTDFHAYFIALARAAGVPARFAIGATIPADTGDGKIAGYHCWAEFLADGKWVPVDISEASNNPALGDYYFGHNPANRFELSRGRDLVPEPEPRSGPINFLVYPLLEVDGKPVKVETEFAFHRTKS
jgi:transglutaminase-like putative cysteine protease